MDDFSFNSKMMSIVNYACGNSYKTFGSLLCDT